MTVRRARALRLADLHLPARHLRLLSGPAARSKSQWVGMRAVEWKKPACTTLGELVDWVRAGQQRYLICIPGVGRKMAGEVSTELERLKVPVNLTHTLLFGRER